MNTTEQLNSLDAINSLPVSIKYMGEAVPANWGGQACDQWRATIDGQSFDYFTGLGLRRKFYKNGQNHVETVKPAIADILAALVRDAQALNASFYDWCADFGYDTDSLQALDVYRACMDTGRKLSKTFTRAQLASIAEATAEL
jgi:hypothetical protein